MKPASVCDNKKFWGTVGPLFSEKCVSGDDITLVENKTIISDDKQVVGVFNSFFSGAVRSLNIDYFEHFSWDCVFSGDGDPVRAAI